MSRLTTVFFAMVVLLNLLYNATFPLYFDEAYYWVWSQHLQLSYFDHPPMIAYLIRVATLFGAGEWQIRLVPLFCSILAGLGIWRLASDLYGSQVGTKALVIFLTVPLAQLGFSLATPDAPLILGWTAVIFFVYKAVFEEKRGFYYAAGLAAGFTLLAKYTGVLLLPGLLLFFLFSNRRDELCRKEPLAGIGLALLLFLPVLIWNAGHDWSSFLFQLNHGLADKKVLNLATFGEYLGVQAAGMGPLLFFSLLYLLACKFRLLVSDERQAFLLWPCVTVLTFFGYAALFKRVEGNWAAPAYVTGIILVAKWLDSTKRIWLYRTGIAMALAMTLLLKVPEVFDFLPPPLVLKQQVLGYDAMFQAGGRYLGNDASLVLASDYKIASLAWYYLPGQPTVHVLTASRFSQFDFWREGLRGQMGANAIFFGSAEQEEELARLFTEVIPLDPLSYSDRYVSREIKVYRCQGLRIIPGSSSGFQPSR